MKRTGLIFLLILIVTALVSAQNGVDVGLNVHLGIPMGEMSDAYGTGFGGDMWIIIPLESPTVSLAIGAGYEAYPGKSTTESSSGSWGWETTTTTYSSTGLGSIFFGPKIGKENGAYFLPAVSLNIETEVMFGVDIGGGVLIPIGTGSSKLNLGAKYSIANIVGSGENSRTLSGIRLIAGIVF